MQRYFYMYEKNAKTHYIFLFFQNIIFLETWPYAHEIKHFIYIYIYFFFFFEMRGFVFFFF
jgi:hypothetical protein